MRTLLALLAAIVAVGAISAGPLAEASAGLDVPVDDVAGQEVAKLLLIETLEEDEARWEPDRLGAFVDDLGVDRAEGLDVEVVETAAGTGLAVTVEALGETQQACVVADEDDLPVTADGECR